MTDYCRLDLRGGIGMPDSTGDVICFEDVRKELLSAWCAQSLLITIDSGGGLVAEGDKLYSVIRSHPAKCKVAIVARAVSSAVKVVLGCPERWARHDASLLIHRIDRRPPRRWTADAHKAEAERLQHRDAELAAFYARRTGKASLDWFLQQMRDERPMPLEVAMECGLIHRVLAAPSMPPVVQPPSTYWPEGQQPRRTFAYLTRDVREIGGDAGRLGVPVPSEIEAFARRFAGLS